MNQRTARANYVDASALVKVFADEPDSEAVRTYFHARANEVHHAILLLRNAEHL
jgi:hypothetical protein